MMKCLFAIAVLLFAACGFAVGDAASDERELTQLVNDLNAAIVKLDIRFLERVLAKDYVHYRPHGNVETRAQYLEDRKSASVDFDSLVADDIKVRVYSGYRPSRSIVPPRKEKIRMERLTSSAAGPASSFERTVAGSSCTLRAQRSRSSKRAWSSKTPS